MIIDDLPSGSFWVFALNLLISYFFQIVGFLLTYLLHTSHAAKYGSRAGLGLTMIQFGFYTRTQNGAESDSNSGIAFPQPTDTMLPPDSIPQSPAQPDGLSSREWMAFILMTLGDFETRVFPLLF
jgi:Protein of unknown function (DUF2370)